MHDQFLNRVEGHTGKSFRYRAEMDSLLSIADTRGMEQVFADAMFHATFVVKTRDVMERIGAGAEGFDTLSAQFGEGLERVTTLVRTLIKEEPEEWKQDFSSRFFRMEQESLARMLDLLSDLSLIKHWEVDGHPLPFQGYVSPRKERITGKIIMEQHLNSLTRAARLALLLIIVLFIVDGPFTLIGWITALLIAGLLILIQYEGAAAAKETRQAR